MYHEYSQSEISNLVNWITSSIERLIERDGDLLNPASIESDDSIEGEKILNREIHESSINHRLAVHMEFLAENFNINDYHFDVEYNRFINQRKKVVSIQTGERIEVRPDILVHSRTNFEVDIPHFLVVEAKKYSVIEKDRNHINDIMRDDNYRYKYGCLISYYESNKTVNCELVILNKDTFENIQISVNKKEN